MASTSFASMKYQFAGYFLHLFMLVNVWSDSNLKDLKNRRWPSFLCLPLWTIKNTTAWSANTCWPPEQKIWELNLTKRSKFSLHCLYPASTRQIYNYFMHIIVLILWHKVEVWENEKSYETSLGNCFHS